MDDYILISMLNQFDYCPHRCYLMFVEGVFADNEHTVAGSLLHKRSDTYGREKRVMPSGQVTEQFRSVWLYSHKYQMMGRADIIEESHGWMYPVEVKKGGWRRSGKGTEAWINDALQLCAQALCLEEMLGLEAQGAIIDTGYVFYVENARRQSVELSPKIRAETHAAIEAVHARMRTRNRPPNPYTPRCRGCSLYSICLPRETEKLRNLTD